MPDHAAWEFQGEQEIQIHSWPMFETSVSDLRGEWIFRGQSDDWDLTTSLERCLNDWGVGLDARRNVEHQMIRDFRRRYRGADYAMVQDDRLYCLTTMQHYGAPTRLLDWTYSPFVAAKFAIEKGAHQRRPVIWCVRTAWCYTAAVEVVGADIIDKRNADETRNDQSFMPLFFGRPKRFVFHEDPFYHGERLTIQQGTFLCPGDVATSFLSNLQELKGWNSVKNVLRLRLNLEPSELERFSTVLRRMNVSSAVLFPGLDGFARSLAELIPFYVRLGARSVGLSGQRVDEESFPI